VTVSFWNFGDASQPRSDTSFYASGPGEPRVLNSHTPWSNSNVYWDAGAVGGGYDRINKAASAADFKGRWNHWVFTKDATLTDGSDKRMRIYVNGSLFHSGASQTGLNRAMDGIDTFRISATGGSSYLGRIDDFAVWDGVLPDNSIQSMAAGLSAGTVVSGTLSSGTVSPDAVKTTLSNTGGTLSPGGSGAIGTTEFAGGNLAPGGHASQSTTRSGGGAAYRANDGDTNGQFFSNSVTHTSGGPPPWWIVDLGSEASLDTITLWNRTDCCGDRLSNFRVSILDASQAEIWGQDYYTGGGNPSPSLAIPLPGGVDGQFVKVEKYDTGILSLAEVQVAGGFDYTQILGGTLEIDIDGLAGTADKLIVGGELTLGGLLDVALVTQPTSIGRYDIMDWGQLSGEFDAISLPKLDSQALSWDTRYLYETGELVITPEPASLTLLGLGALALVRRRRRA
jgi:hypothetical protein